MSKTSINEEQSNSDCSVCDSKEYVSTVKTRLPVKFNRAVLGRDCSFESNSVISRCSSIESMLELRKPDPEEVLIGLGFGPSQNSSMSSRIPQRFLHPSKLLKNIDINKFLERYGEVPASEYRFNSLPNSPARPRPRSS